MHQMKSMRVEIIGKVMIVRVMVQMSQSKVRKEVKMMNIVLTMKVMESMRQR